MKKEKSRSQKLDKADKKSKDKKSKKDNKPEIDYETPRFLLGQKLIYLNTIAKVCMSWWVSSIVFCGTILAAVWLRRDELVNSLVFIPLGIAIASFFASFIYFGITAIQHLSIFKTEISELLEKLKFADSEPVSTNIFDMEIGSIRRGIEIGIGTFILILIVWIALFLSLHFRLL